jgi:hypothetical protein
MRAWQNERGGVLIYVLMISMVLVAMVPLVLSLTTNTALSDQVSRNEKLATHLSIGGIESFIRYLDQYTSGDRTTYLDDFNGFVTNKQFTTPEGIQVTYSLTKSAMEDNLYSITASVTAGTGRTARSKEIVYQINASMGRPSVPEVTPDSRTDDILIKGIYLDADTGNHSGLESTDSSKNVTVEETAGLQKAIGNAITNITTSVLASVTSWDAQVASCGCTTMNGIDNNINYSSSVLQVIKVSGNISMDGSINYTWGSPSKPVIVIFEGPVYLKNGGTLNVYGDLIFKDRFETDGGMVIDVNKVNGDYGNLYALGMFDGKNGGTFSMDGMFYADAVDIQNNATFTASKMVVKGQIETKNQLTVNIPREERI